MGITGEETKREVLRKIKRFWKRFWYIIWEDESLLGWVISLAFAFLVIKFIFFPSLGLVLGTKMPLVVVESGSMHHPGSFLFNYFGSDKLVTEWWQVAGKWYEERGIDFNETFNWSLRNGLEIGDVILVVKARNIELGDIIIFEANQRHPVIHRVINISEVNNRTVYSTKGDNNPAQLFVETRIPEDAIIGQAVFRIPMVGWVKLIFVKLLDVVVRR
jgi:signal peptidase I